MFNLLKKNNFCYYKKKNLNDYRISIFKDFSILLFPFPNNTSFFPSDQDLYSYKPIKLSRNASFPSESVWKIRIPWYVSVPFLSVIPKSCPVYVAISPSVVVIMPLPLLVEVLPISV